MAVASLIWSPSATSTAANPAVTSSETGMRPNSSRVRALTGRLPSSVPLSSWRTRSVPSLWLRHSWSRIRSRRAFASDRAGTPLTASSEYRSIPSGSSYGTPR